MPAWSAYEGPNGAIYYYNSITQESTWTKPEELYTPYEKALEASPWSEYTDANTGKTYWHNVATNKSVWDCPPELSSYAKNSDTNTKKKTKKNLNDSADFININENSDFSKNSSLDRSKQNINFNSISHNNTLKPNNNNNNNNNNNSNINNNINNNFNNNNNITNNNNPALVAPYKVDIKAPLLSRPPIPDIPAEEIEKKFFEMLKEGKVDESWSWERAVATFCSNNKFFFLYKSSKERHDAFLKYIAEYKRKAEDDKIKAKENFRKNFIHTLETLSDPPVRTFSRWETVQNKLLNSYKELYYSIEDEDYKKKLFDEYISGLSKQAKEEKLAARELALKNLRHYLAGRIPTDPKSFIQYTEKNHKLESSDSKNRIDQEFKSSPSEKTFENDTDFNDYEIYDNAVLVPPQITWEEIRSELESEFSTVLFSPENPLGPLTIVDLLAEFENHMARVHSTWTSVLREKQDFQSHKERTLRFKFIDLIHSLLSASPFEKPSIADDGDKTDEFKITIDTKWKDLYKAVLYKNEIFLSMCGQSGSSPLELFWDEIARLDRGLKSIRDLVLDVLEDSHIELSKYCNAPFALPENTKDGQINKSLNNNTEINDEKVLKEITPILRANKKTAHISDNILQRLCGRLVAKHVSRRARRIDALRHAIKHLSPQVTVNDTWPVVRSRVAHYPEFIALEGDDEGRMEAWNILHTKLKERANAKKLDKEPIKVSRKFEDTFEEKSMQSNSNFKNDGYHKTIGVYDRYINTQSISMDPRASRKKIKYDDD